MSKPPSVFHVDRLDLVLQPKVWDFAAGRRAEIETFFLQLQAQQPALWNGRVLLMHRHLLDDGVLRGWFLETDYASFAAWQRWGQPAAAIYDCFGAAAVMAADGAFLVGVMAMHTLNAGHIYFPCGTPDASDIVGGKVDFEFSVRRELREETGLDAAELATEPGWTIVVDGVLIAAIKVLRSTLAADPLRARILDRLALEQQAELSDICIVRSSADFDPMMRPFVKAFLAQRFATDNLASERGSS
jgi:8-oxo-dGTP pyrophosphatase MutT (NUDIX family)